MAEEIVVEVTADTKPVSEALSELEKLANSFGQELTGALKSAVVNGNTLKDVLRSIGTSLAGKALSLGLAPLEKLASSLFSSLLGGLLPFSNGGIVPFASGGVVASPTFFPAGKNIGLMGEAGPEAIIPLQRGSDGRLGVAGGGGGGPVNVVFNVAAPDPAAFQKSEAQVTGMLARAVSRGLRSL